MKYFLLGCFCLATQVGLTQSWQRFNDIPAINIIDLKADGNMMYAASFSNKIYISADHGATWRASVVGAQGVKVTVLTLFNNKLYAGTDANGIYMSSDTGRNWIPSGAGLLTISALAEWRNGLYASTLGTGIFRLNEAINLWIPLNNGIPNYSVNVFDIINTNDSLIAAAGANGTFYRYDAPSAQWIEKYYFSSTLKPGLLISNMFDDSGTILSVTGAQLVLRSDNAGGDWYYDTVKLKRGPKLHTRVSAGANKYYAAISDAFDGGTWIQYKDKLPGPGHEWITMQDTIATGYTIAIREFSDKLYLCRTDGLYYQDKVTAVNDPVTNDPLLNEVSIYPNPILNGIINLKSRNKINEIKLVSMSGSIVYQSQSQQKEYNISNLSAGVYVAYITIGKKVKAIKIIKK